MPRATRSRLLRPASAVALGIACLLGAIWVERRPIATAVVDRKLAEAHVRGRYQIVDLGLGRQRLVDVVIGDPRHPDLAAKWIELGTRVGLDGAQVTAVRAGGLRLRASLADGRLSLGELDRLLPRSTGGGPFRFLAIDLEVADGRVQITSPFGVVDVALTGSGRLDNGFRGRVAASSRQLTRDGCTATAVSAGSTVSIRSGEVSLAGPLKAARVRCRGASAEQLTADAKVTLAQGMTAWRGRFAAQAAHLAAAPFAMSSAHVGASFAGSTAATTAGELTLIGGPGRVGDITGRALAVAGRYRLSGAPSFVGTAKATGVSLPLALRAAIRRQGHAAAATPLAPLLHRAADALAKAASDVTVSAQVAATSAGVLLSRAEAAARSGARATFAPDRPIRVAPGTMPAITGTAHLSGGGLPEATVRLTQAKGGGAISGIATILPYAADGARLALAPVRFTANRAGTHVDTVATISGPLADGRVERLRLPIVADWNGGVLRLGSGCTAVSFDRLMVSTLTLGATRLPLCPMGSALVRVGAGEIQGGARLPALHLSGSLGSTALTLAATDTRLSLGTQGLTARNVDVRLGEGESATHLTVGRLLGTASSVGLDGKFERAGGQIGKVPLLLSDADGNWRFVQGALSLGATATVTDAAPADRIKPLRADALKFRLARGTIDATAQLVVPGKAIPVATVAIAHDLGSGIGRATLDVPRLAFGDALQPDELTPLTFGVIADVRGTVSGDARIDWSATGVISAGTFRTGGLDLAAAFGPVSGLAGTIHFTDLLALESAPGQTATVVSINPGIPVTDGRFVYRTLPNSRVAVSSGHWPFAGGSLDLRPTLLDFGAPSERHLIFTLTGVDAGRFLQQFDFANISATGVFDGTLPMIFDVDGGRIEGGHLEVRPGGGNLAYVGDLTQKDLGVWGNLAFQALRSIDYRDLSIAMNGPLAGEMITDVRFAGISQGKGAKSNFLIRRLQKLPFVFNIHIRAPFRGLIDSAQSFYDPSRLIVRNLPALIQQQNATPSVPADPVQPAARETLP